MDSMDRLRFSCAVAVRRCADTPLLRGSRLPNSGQQLGIGHHAARPAHQAMQDVEFLARQVHGLPALGDVRFTGSSRISPISMGASSVRAGARRGARRADAGDQFAGAERLGNVIVRAEVERLHFVFFLVAHGQHQDRQPRSKSANAAQRLNAADARHIHVEQHSVVGCAHAVCSASSPREASAT